jgi:hypothetical protein
MADGHSTAGRSIIEMLWEQADILYAKLMDVEEPWQADDIAEVIGSRADQETAEEQAQEITDYWELRGKLGGLSYALGRMLHMYDKPKDAIDKIKAELRERWESENEEEE